MYYSLIGDIVHSKSIENRYELQTALGNYLDQLNQDYRDFLASGFTLTLGDEFQALFSVPDKLFETIFKIENKMHPVKIRFAIGIGTIKTGIQKDKALGSDGPAWWEARAMIEAIKSNKRGRKEMANIQIAGLKNRELEDLINVSLSFCVKTKEKWTDSQRFILDYLLESRGLSGDFLQNEVAAELKLTPPDLNKKLKAANYYDFVLMIEKITNVLMKEETNHE